MVSLCIYVLNLTTFVSNLSRAVDPHSFYADPNPDPAVFLNADPDSGPGPGPGPA